MKKDCFLIDFRLEMLYNNYILYLEKQRKVILMEISLKRDGLTLRGDLLKPEGIEKCPAVVIFHGIMSSRGKTDESMFYRIAYALLKKGIASVRFDFNGHGDSDGEFRDMNVLNEILDAGKIIDYVRSLPFVTDIYIVGHSQGALVGSMIAGYYREYVSKLVMLAPAATIKDDALLGSCFGVKYDSYYLPEYMPMKDLEKNEYELGNMYYRVAKTLPVYETAAMFRGETLIIHGTGDEAVGIEGTLRYEREMKNVTVELIKGEEHGLDKFSLDYVINRTAEFLAG